MDFRLQHQAVGIRVYGLRPKGHGRGGFRVQAFALGKEKRFRRSDHYLRLQSPHPRIELYIYIYICIYMHICEHSAWFVI